MISPLISRTKVQQWASRFILGPADTNPTKNRLNLPEVMMGTGSACTSGTLELSHVLLAMGLNRADAGSTVRASLGRFTTQEQIECASSLILETARSLPIST